MDTFHLLHVSDLHIAVRPRMVGFPDWKSLPQLPGGKTGVLAPSSYDPFLVEAVARWLDRHPNRFDLVLVTGDLATTGHPADLALAHDYLFAPVASAYWSQTGQATLQVGRVPLCIMPGNHDRYEGWYLGPGGAEFDATFGQKGWSAAQGAQALIALQGSNGEKLAIVAADFSLASYWHSTRIWGYLGQGKVYPSVLQALRQVTLQERERHGSVAVVWAVHFPPDFVAIDPDLALLNEQNLLDEAAALDVWHFFCGHTHEAREYAPAGNPLIRVHCAGTTTQYATQHGNVMHETAIDVNGGRVVAVRRTDVWWSQAAGDFV
jgi:3',5'-cyclic AMP phosphodiesterase CpdA